MLTNKNAVLSHASSLLFFFHKNFQSNSIKLAFFFVFFPFFIYGQNFENITSISGFENVRENNGVAVADYDNDNDLDVFIVAIKNDISSDPSTSSKLFRNNNDGTFTNVTDQAGLSNLYPRTEEVSFFGLAGSKFGAYWGDYDNDGYVDIFLSNYNKIQLFHNNGDGTFENVTEQSGFPLSNDCSNNNVSWFDYNNDSYLDLFIADWKTCGSNKLYRNNKDGTFQDISQQIGLVENISNFHSYTSFPFDFNNDGWMDIYVANDLSRPNRLYINNKGEQFEDQAINFGLNSNVDDMGIAIGDYNNDGNFDFFITAIEKNVLYHNNGNNIFTNIALSKGVNNTGWSWGTTFADFDLDGDLDLFVASGFELLRGTAEDNVYYKNELSNSQNNFIDITSSLGMNDLGSSVSTVDFDYDNDGDLDLFVTNSDKQPFFYENKTINTSDSSLNWFKIHLEGTVSNKSAIGTKISLTTSQGTIHRYFNGVGFLSQNIKPVHFGLIDDSEITELKIKWPSGIEEVYNSITVNNSIKAIENGGFTYLEISPTIKIEGCIDPTSCNYNPEATISDGSCTYLPSQEIIGSNITGFLSEETYTYSISQGSTIQWQVAGGEIIEGQGTETILVKWGLEPHGKVNVIETDTTCSSKNIGLEINFTIESLSQDKSIVRLWNEALLNAIRNDYARPTVHARNLFHHSVAMYDAWAIYDVNARPYLIGNELNGFSSELNVFESQDDDIKDSQIQAISYASYRLLSHRFKNSPNADTTQDIFDLVMSKLDYDVTYTATDYQNGDARALGNFIAETIINYGNMDMSNEINDYENIYYKSVNPPMNPETAGNTTMIDPNRWQPLSLETFIDQSGNEIGSSTPDFLSPEWGSVYPFALTDEHKSTFNRSGNNFTVFHDPVSPPPLLTDDTRELYKWGFSMVSVWGSHLDINDGVQIDISPKSLGNIDSSSFPTDYSSYGDFYEYFNGGDNSTGHSLNPSTNEPYQEQIVPRGDYTRVLAEFWADGPESETPPGHWFTLLNYINDNPLLVKKLGGEGEILDPIEWEVKSYFILGGAMHDAAVTSWSLKGWYDYIRPISAIRFMADKGQSSDPSLNNYDIQGIKLIADYIEVVSESDPLAGVNNEHVGKIKLYTWKGHDYISNTDTDYAGVGWILAENWWPYQRPSFVTPPFAGFISGHSTFSRAAAEVLTSITGDPFFPGGIGEFVAKSNEFLVFEEGPSVDLTLQWATYRDASDQCSLSRIWGGIHPSFDDIPGRIIGEKIGKDAYSFAIPYFDSSLGIEKEVLNSFTIYPNPTNDNVIYIKNLDHFEKIELFDVLGKRIISTDLKYDTNLKIGKLSLPQSISKGIYILKIDNQSNKVIIN